MLIDQYLTAEGSLIHFTREQASLFAKQVADDFNPIHDPDAKRFCVPGDLLFAVALSRVGLSQRMHVNFTDMVTDGVKLTFPAESSKQISIADEQGKHYLDIECEGENTRESGVIDALTRQYVEFSGHTFPHILVPLWAENGVMINPARPLVIYQSMSIELERLDLIAPRLEIAGTDLDVQGKRGNVQLSFNLLDGDLKVGTGEKRMVLSGLREFDQEQVDGIVDFYNRRKDEAGF